MRIRRGWGDQEMAGEIIQAAASVENTLLPTKKKRWVNVGVGWFQSLSQARERRGRCT